MSVIAPDVKIVILGLGRVPVIDATGLVALESALDRLQRDKRFVIIAGPLPSSRPTSSTCCLPTTWSRGSGSRAICSR
jgi:anti-anti-sigma regulatory factor